MKTLYVAPLTAIAVCGALLSFEASAALPGFVPPGAPRTLDLTAVPMTITEPGTYLVRHDWDLGNAVGESGTAITVMASDVVIDFQRYQIKFNHIGTGVKVKGQDVRLRNGSLLGANPSSLAVRSSGTGTVIENMSIFTTGLELRGRGAEVRDSEIRGGVVVGDDAVVERNLIVCRAGCAVLANNDRLEHNRIQLSFGGAAAFVHGARNFMIDNVLEYLGGGGSGSSVEVIGSGNTLLRNTIVNFMQFDALIEVDGTANTLDANVAPPVMGGPLDAPLPSYNGIRFKQAGNFYGNNRISANTPYDLGGLPQTDWGGNVSY